MLCHVPTLTSVGLEVAKKTTISMFSGNRGKSAKLRDLPVVNAASDAAVSDNNDQKIEVNA
jgi:hypothetical protein